MKSFEEILPLIVATIVAVVLFFGLVTTIRKSLKAPAKRDTIDSTLQLKEQQQRAQDVRQRQRQLMRDQKQKMRDMQRR